MGKELREIVEKVMKDGGILAVMLFGSYARDEKFSDIDVCIIMLPKNFDALSLSRKRLEYLKDFPDYDLRIFQQLPLYIRMRVLKEGKIIFCRDEDALYDLAMKTVREFEYFEPVYSTYLDGVLHA